MAGNRAGLLHGWAPHSGTGFMVPKTAGRGPQTPSGGGGRPPRYPADGRDRAWKAPPRMGRVSARMRRSTWRRPSLRALLSAVRSCSPVLLVACPLGIAPAPPPAADTPPDPVGGAPAPPTAAAPPEPPLITPIQEVRDAVVVDTTEPQFVAPTQIGRAHV